MKRGDENWKHEGETALRFVSVKAILKSSHPLLYQSEKSTYETWKKKEKR
jgi:hypothetical protein